MSSRGRGTSAASCYMNSKGDMAMWVVPSRQGILSCSTSWPARVRLKPRSGVRFGLRDIGPIEQDRAGRGTIDSVEDIE